MLGTYGSIGIYSYLCIFKIGYRLLVIDEKIVIKI